MEKKGEVKASMEESEKISLGSIKCFTEITGINAVLNVKRKGLKYD